MLPGGRSSAAAVPCEPNTNHSLTCAAKKKKKVNEWIIYNFQFKKKISHTSQSLTLGPFRIWPFRVHASGFKVCRKKILKYVRDIRGLAETTKNKDNTTAILKLFIYVTGHIF